MNFSFVAIRIDRVEKAQATTNGLKWGVLLKERAQPLLPVLGLMGYVKGFLSLTAAIDQ
jgi:hypothetical protein